MAELPTGTVTFLFTDLQGSSRLWEEHPEAMRSALARHDEILREAIEAHEGSVVKMTGDGAHGAFATAHHAVAAAVAAQLALGNEQWGATGPLRVRMGLHSGVAEQRAGDYFGPVLNRAARLMSVAHPGQVLCTRATADLVRDSPPARVGIVDLGGHRLRDLERPEVVFHVIHPDLPSDFPPLLSAGGVLGNLPRQLTSFVGREDDLMSIARELDQTSVVTLTGVGGVGKTRLALEVAARTVDRWRDGAWLCELAGVRDADAVFDAVLDMFDIEPGQGDSAADALLRFLRSKELVIVLDNCEHLLKPAARLVTEVVRSCPGVRVLATSREGLNVAGERILAVASLDVPESSEDVGVIAASDAVRLFVARARAVRSGFVLDAHNAVAVAQICGRLDGVPLAIELAAARVGMLTPADLAQRLDQRFHLLTGGERGAVERHQTLRAAIDWSYELLDDAERRLLNRLSVFAGGFTLAAAESVAAGDGIEASEVFELLAGLVARSLVLADTEGAQARYHLLETIRQYAEERLAETGETTRLRDSHARFFAALIEEAAAGLTTPAQLEWLARIHPDVDNIRVALGWAIEREDADTVPRFYTRLYGHDEEWAGFSEVSRARNASAAAASRIGGVAGDPRFSIILACAAVHASWRGEVEDMHRYLEKALTAEEQLEVEPSGVVTGVRSWVAMVDGRLDDYRRYADEDMALWRATGNRVPLARSLSGSAMARALKGEEMDVAVAEADEALTLAEATGIPTVLLSVEASAAFVLADVQPERARTLMEDAVRRWAVIPGYARSPVHSVLGDVAERVGDRRLALEYFVLGMDEWHWLGNAELVGRMLRRIGLLLVEHQPEAAALIIGAGLTRTRAATLTERVNAYHREGIAVLDVAIGADRCRMLQADGAALDEYEAVVMARAAAARELARLNDPP